MSCSIGDTGLACIVALKSPNAAGLITVSGTGATRTLTIQMDTAGFYLFRLWLVDSATAPQLATLTPPTGDAAVQWDLVTDATGLLTKTITHAGPADTWYMAVVLLGVVQLSDAIAFT